MNINDFTDKFSASAVSKEDGLVRLTGKWGVIEEDVFGKFFVCVCSELKPLSTTRRRRILNELHCMGLAGMEDHEAEEFCFSISASELNTVANLIGVKRKRKLSEEQKLRLTSQLQKDRGA